MSGKPDFKFLSDKLEAEQVRDLRPLKHGKEPLKKKPFLQKRKDEVYMVFACPCCGSGIVQAVSSKAAKWLFREFKSRHRGKLQPIETEMTLYTEQAIRGCVMPQEFAGIEKELRAKEVRRFCPECKEFIAAAEFERHREMRKKK